MNSGLKTHKVKYKITMDNLSCAKRCAFFFWITYPIHTGIGYCKFRQLLRSRRLSMFGVRQSACQSSHTGTVGWPYVSLARPPPVYTRRRACMVTTRRHSHGRPQDFFAGGVKLWLGRKPAAKFFFKVVCCCTLVLVHFLVN